MKNLHIACLFLALLLGCTKKEIETIYVMQKDELKTGTVYGYVHLADQRQDTIANKSGVAVSLQANNFKKSRLTDSTGRYAFDSIPAGKYTLHFERVGFGTENREFIYSTPGGNKPYLFRDAIGRVPNTGRLISNNRTWLYERSKTVPSPPTILYPKRKARAYDDTLVYLSGTYSPSQPSINLRPRFLLLYDTVSGVGEARYLGSYGFRVGSSGYNQKLGLGGQFENGQIYYARIYSYFSSIDWWDPLTNERGLLPLGATPTPEFTFRVEWE